MQQVVFASGNAGKVRELAAMLADREIELLPQSDFAVPAVAETGATFVENAILKARNACTHSGLPALADDSGLAVDGLGGAPGVHSARWAGGHGDDAANNARLVAELRGLPMAGRTARFHCVMAFLRNAGDPMPLIAAGSWQGLAICEPRGNRGFGYDPHFWVAEYKCTAAELPAAEKNRVSHRARALQDLLEAIDALR